MMAEAVENKQRLKAMANGVVRFFREIKSEIKKIIWPTPKEIKKGTGITLAAIAIIGVFIWLVGGLIDQGIVLIVNR